MARALLENEIIYMRCTLCDNFLSVPPIKILSADGKENQCGRCKDIEYKGSVRNLCFENLAKHLSFPCIYKNCNENILWTEIEEHEKTCQYKSIRCPIYYQHKCQEVVEIAQFENHIKKKHPTNIFFGNVLKRDIGVLSSTVHYLKADTGDFIIYILQDHIFVGSLGPIKRYNKYNVQISSHSSTQISLSYNDQDIVEFDERLHCYKCKRGLCSSKHHLHSRDNPKTTDRDSLIINKNTIIELFGNPQKILLSVTLVDGDLQDLPEVTMTRSRVDREQILDRNSLVITRSLECIICLEYLVGDIYTCASGHLMCQQCKQNHRDCPLCKVRLGEAKCLLAKSFSKDIQLVCQTEGCNFIGNLERLALHEKNCPDLSGKPKDEKKIM